MAKLFNMHPSDDQLDLYLVGHLCQREMRWVEEHYLTCTRCLDRLTVTADFIAALNSVEVNKPHPSTQHFLPQSRLTPKSGSERSSQRQVMHWGSYARSAALLLIGSVGTFLFEAPVRLSDALPIPAIVHIGPPILTDFAQPMRSESRRMNYSRRFRSVHHSRPNHAFHPPSKQHPTLVEAKILNFPRLRPTPVTDLMAGQWPPPDLPPFQAKRRWFRRVLAALKKGFEPSWQ